MGWLYAGATSLTARIPLPRTIGPGQHFLMLKLIDYMGGSVSAEMGGARAETTPNNGDWNRQWTTPMPLSVASSTDSLLLTFHKHRPPTEVTKFLLRGLYLTTNKYENVPLYGYDRIVDYSTNAVEWPHQLETGNLLSGSSFESALGHGWGYKSEGTERS